MRKTRLPAESHANREIFFFGGGVGGGWGGVGGGGGGGGWYAQHKQAIMPPFIHVSDRHDMASLLIIVMGSNGKGRRKNHK